MAGATAWGLLGLSCVEVSGGGGIVKHLVLILELPVEPLPSRRRKWKSQENWAWAWAWLWCDCYKGGIDKKDRCHGSGFRAGPVNS
jgi:hypothetical protein